MSVYYFYKGSQTLTQPGYWWCHGKHTNHFRRYGRQTTGMWFMSVKDTRTLTVPKREEDWYKVTSRYLKSGRNPRDSPVNLYKS